MKQTKNKYSSAYNRANNERWKNAAQEKTPAPKKRYKPLPMWLTALRNFLLFTVIMALLLTFMFVGGNDLTAFYSEEDFAKYAEIKSEFVEYEGKWMPWTEHEITVVSVSKRYQYAAAVIDFSEYETDDCYSGVINFDGDAVSNRQQLEHILILNPTHGVGEHDGLYIYTEDELFNKAYGCRPAEEFYELQREYEAEHINLLAIMQNDFDHIMYNLMQGSGLKWILPIVLLAVCAVYAIFVYRKRTEMSLEGLSTITVLWGVSLITVCLGVMGLMLVGGDMAAEGGIGGVVTTVIAIVTGIAALLYLVSMLLPLLLDVDFVYGFSVFWIKVIASFGAAAVAFGIGTILEAFMEKYTILHTVIMIVLVIVALMAFYAFAGMLAARSVIFKTYMDISIATIEVAERAGSVWLMYALSAKAYEYEQASNSSYGGYDYFADKKRKIFEDAAKSIERDLNGDD